MALNLIFAALLAASSPQDPDPTVLDDVVVEGVRRDRETSFAFVRAVSAPPFGSYSMAVWTKPVCLSIDNLRPEQAAALSDRILGRVEHVGAEVGESGCTPNVTVIFTADGAATASDLLAHNRGDMRPTSASTQLDRGALSRFATEERPVRWWTVNMPVDESGSRAIAMLGDIGNLRGQQEQLGVPPEDFSRVAGGGPPWRKMMGIRPLQGGVHDALVQTIVVVDARLTSGLSFASLGDYIAMVALTQADPEAEVSDAPTILNLFAERPRVTEMSKWDLDYLTALYATRTQWTNIRFQQQDIARRMVEASLPSSETP